jgi:hypothetical protein
LKSALKKMDENVLSAENTASVRDTLTSLRAASETLEGQVKKLDPLLAKGEAAMTTFGETADSFKQTGAAFTKAAEKAGKVFGEASDGAGLLPALLNDPILRDDTKALVANLRSRGFLFYKNPPSEKPASTAPLAAPRRPSPPLPASSRPPGR